MYNIFEPLKFRILLFCTAGFLNSFIFQLIEMSDSSFSTVHDQVEDNDDDADSPIVVSGRGISSASSSIHNEHIRYCEILYK